MNEYKLMIAPFHHNGFRSLSKKQAEEYFHWYVGQSKERIEQHDKNRLRNAYRTWTKYTAETTPNIADTFSSIRSEKYENDNWRG